MSAEQPSSDDLLSRMKEQVHLRREYPHGSFISVTADEMSALVECAEALPIIAEWADAGRHEEDFSAIAKKARDALAKLEVL